MSKHVLFLRPGFWAVVSVNLFVVSSQMAHATAVTTLETVVVTGLAPKSPLTFVTDPKQPRQPLPASDGTDYLKTIPGFSAIRNGGSNGDPVLRGMFGSRLNILVNGSSMPGACPSRMDSPSSYISPENFDELTVIKGPQTVLWGPGASAGTIRFDRNPPQFTEPGILFDGALTGGSWGRNDQSADLAAGNDKVYTRVTANRSHSQDYKDGDGNRVASRWDKWNADIALGFTPDADTLIELNAGLGDGEARYAGRGMDGTQFKRESLGLRFQKKNLGETLKKVEAQVYYNYADHVMDNYSLRPFKPGGGMNMPMASNVDRATWGGRFAGSWQWSDALGLVAGMDFQESRHRKRSGMGMQSYSSQPWVKDATFGNMGAFAELTWHVGESDRIIGGARADKASVKDFRQRTGSGMMTMPNPTAGERRTDTLASGFLRYEHDLEALPATMYVGLGHVQRFPDYWELFSPSRGPVGSPNAFHGIKPEKTTQLDIGAQYKSNSLEAWISAYAGQVDDFILFNYMPAGMMGATTRASNVGARILGGELGASYRLAPAWSVGATAAYAWGKNRRTGEALPQIPPLEARFSVAYDDGRWSGGALWRVVAAQKRYAQGQGNVVSKDFGPSAGFGIFSLNGGYAASKRVRFTVGVDNLFNKTYHEHLNLAGNAGFGYPANTPINEPGRTVWATVSLKY
ncbi:TonB-dependent copper receptor [Alcaligenaceae bacterium]|nr:TonB-dependent copper receptor [Alcaligenaceae bacterium]